MEQDRAPSARRRGRPLAGRGPRAWTPGEFLAGRSADICYLDPPYAVHQYGSNYFMLNTIARWDRPPVSEERGPDGRLRQKAGIRADWKRTRSAFCYRDTAAAALTRRWSGPPTAAGWW